METRHYLWLAVGALGFASGMAIPKMAGGRPAETPQAAPAPAAAKTERGGAEGSKVIGPVTLPALAELPASTDTIESLLALKGTEQYTRAGLWLLDATEEDMADFWKAYHKSSGGKTDMWLKDLIFTQWAKKNPRGLLEAAKRDKEEGPAWWAWSMSDPDAALAEVAGHGDAMRNFVLRGLANFHPKKALKMLEKDPSLASQFNMKELAEEVGRGDPRAGMEFMQRYPNSYSTDSMFKSWAAEDPHAAFEWLSENERDQSLRKAFFDTVAAEKPEVFAELASGLPSGALKWELETAAFRELAHSDPDKALEEARKLESPVLAAQRLAQVGKELVDEHPERALEALSELMEKCPDAPFRMSWTRYPDGASGGNGALPQVNELLGSLAAWDPKQTMERMLQIEQGHPEFKDTYAGNGTGSDQVAKAWVARDLSGYSAWLEGQDEPARDRGAGTAAAYLMDKQDFGAAAEWCLKISQSNNMTSALGNTVSNWIHRDREAAIQWLENAPISAEQRQAVLRNYPELNSRDSER